jgi:hypothetical protein
MSVWTALALLAWAGGIVCFIYLAYQMFRLLAAEGADVVWRAIAAGRIWSIPEFPEPAATYFRKWLVGFFVFLACVIFFMVTSWLGKQ